jgi:D-glycero-alpha-D-manno-heptose-7-phosphate kinase
MIISRAPYRISLFGGGTDYPQWYKENGGAVLSTSINKYSYITCRHLPNFFEYKYRIRYYKREEVNSIDSIEHPVIREALAMLNIEGGIDLVHHGDLPAQTGIGSSSSFTVGLLHSLYGMINQMPTKRMLADAAIKIEQELLCEAVGSQDQVAAAFGGLNLINFGGVDNYSVHPVILNSQRKSQLEDSLVMIFTGITRTASELAKDQILSIEINSKKLVRARELVNEALDILQNQSDIHQIGALLDEQWKIKKTLTKNISNNLINEIYDAAKSAGALGGKILGAGGGGFMLFYVPPEKRQAVLDRLKNYLHVPFRFENLGSQVIFHSNE